MYTHLRHRIANLQVAHPARRHIAIRAVDVLEDESSEEEMLASGSSSDDGAGLLERAAAAEDRGEASEQAGAPRSHWEPAGARTTKRGAFGSRRDPFETVPEGTRVEPAPRGRA